MATNLTDAAGGKPLELTDVFDVTPAHGTASFTAVPVARAGEVGASYGPIGRIAAFKAVAQTPAGMFKRHVIRAPGMREPKAHVEIKSERLKSQIRATEKPKDLG